NAIINFVVIEEIAVVGCLWLPWKGPLRLRGRVLEVYLINVSMEFLKDLPLLKKKTSLKM
ncbi:hypothetical protein, partial [Enterobacter cloacae]|uniref:hypothetical protein n=1 Tax=Enterobacter cloacae TaxID=550 RepID=UPI001F5147F8